jgi:hypothetical protein
MSITDLCGSLKSFSDLRRHPIKNRYTESTEVKGGAWFRMTLSRHSDANGPWYLDARKCYLRFKMRITESGTTKSWIDGPTAAVLFDRIKIICGSTVLCDIQNHSLLVTMLENIHHSNATESLHLRTLRGHGTLAQRQAWGQSDTHEYIINASPLGTLLNSSCLLPLNSMNDIHIEYYLGSAQSVLANDSNDITAPSSFGTYSLYDIELHSTYLSSRSIQSYFSSNPLAISCTDYSYRYNQVSSQTNMLKISSSYTSLNSILGYFRAGQVLSFAREKRSTAFTANTVASIQFFVNNIAMYDIPIVGTPQQFQQFLEAFPSIETSDYYTDFGIASQYAIVINLRASPKEFHHVVTSGQSTSTLNSDLCLQLNLTSTLGGMDAALESFLCADVTLHMVGKDLHVKY